MALKYQSAEEIKQHDRALFHGEVAEIEFIVDEPANSEASWYLAEFGGGIMISAPRVSGHTFIPASQIAECEDLIFLSRVNLR